MFVEAGGFLLNTVDVGSGPRTFVAHGGWVGSWELWQEPVQLMQPRWRCIAYDHRGAGASTAPPEAVHPRGLVEDLFAVLDHLGVERCVLAGESMGAMTCLQAVLEGPDRFDGLVLVDGSPAAGGPPDTALVRADYPAYVAAFVDACVPEPDSEHVRRWGRQILLRADPEAAARMFESHHEEQVAPDLTAVTVPTLVLHGELDAVVPVEVGRQVAAAIPGAELVVLPGTGHVPTMTRPQLVVDAVEEWAARALPRP
ncbi:alpha/beta fold hydrolase [Nocardioides taihuensis]|uniref:Alpha/beta fold hydrolase n=1 Tax=Nocardioides taihuensis TaxID=1835606 RepID=A0ABW0BEJ9_9ACTN